MQNLKAAPAKPQLLKLREVSEIVRLSTARVRQLSKIGKFPLPVSLGLRAIAWRASDIDAWIADRPSVTPKESA
jgi:prophage regulatory protein